jgi:hypothetical protein
MDAQDTTLDDTTRKQLINLDMLTEWTQCDCQKLWSTGNLKEGKNEVVPEEPGKMWYTCIQPLVKEVSEWENGTIEGNGVWKLEGVARRFKTALYILPSIVPFAHFETSLTHGCILVYPIFPGSSGTTSFFPSFRFPVDHKFWQSHWVHSLNVSIPNELFSGYVIQHRILRFHFSSNILIRFSISVALILLLSSLYKLQVSAPYVRTRLTVLL